jgi:hypothetical protein
VTNLNACLSWQWRRVVLTSRSPPLFGKIVHVDASLPEVVLAVRLDDGGVTYVDAATRGAEWSFDGEQPTLSE